MIGVKNKLTFDAFQNEELQNALELKIGNYIPFKATALYVNAAFQREAIEASNAGFNWNCIPTFYGSTRLLLPNENALSFIPRKKDEAAMNPWRSFARGVGSIAKRYPEKRIVIYIAGGFEDPSYNPAYELVSNPLRPEDCYNMMNDYLSSFPNVFVLTHAYDNANSYYNDFFSTDHHWNINGAFRAYNEIADALHLEKTPEGNTFIIEDYWFTGSNARVGLDPLQERVFDSDNDYKALTATRANGEQLNGNDHSGFWNASALEKRYLFHGYYYNNLSLDGSYCTITGGRGNRSALLVSSSYRGAIQRPLALSYQSLTVNDQLHNQAVCSSSLSQQIAASNADDIIFIATPKDYDIEESYWE